MDLSPIKLGFVFFGWGIFVALFAVFGAPWLQSRLGIAKTMCLNLGIFALFALGVAIWTLNKPVLIILVILSGIVCGVNIHFPFYLCAVVVAGGMVILASAQNLLGAAERNQRATAEAHLHGSADEVAAWHTRPLEVALCATGT